MRASARRPAALEQEQVSPATCHLASLFHLGCHPQPPAEGRRWGRRLQIARNLRPKRR